MYRIDRVSNRITPVLAKSFSDLGFSERKHLQEWLAFHPQALTTGEDDELLIIQKEFDGFDETRERLDLLYVWFRSQYYDKWPLCREWRQRFSG